MQSSENQTEALNFSNTWLLLQIVKPAAINASLQPQYFILHIMDVESSDGVDFVRFTHNNCKMEGKVLFTNSNRNAIDEKLEKLTAPPTNLAMSPMAKPKYFLVQFSKGCRDLIQAVLPEKEVFWPTAIQPNQREVLIFDGNQKRVATVLLVLDDAQQMMHEFQKLKILCFEMGFDENDNDTNIADDAWILILYTCGVHNIVYTILKNRDTFWQRENPYKDVVAYITNGTNVYQTIIIRKSSNFQTLLAQLNFMKSSCLISEFPLKIDKDKPDAIPPPKFQSLCGTVEQFQRSAETRSHSQLEFNLLELEYRMEEETTALVECFEILEHAKETLECRQNVFNDNCGSINNNSILSSGTENMDDILIITAKHSERAILRANFLKSHFDKITKQRGRKPFNFLHIKIEDGPFSEEITKKYQNTALQIVILCPALLALSHSFLMSQLSAILRAEKVLGILLDVAEEKVRDMQKTALPNYYKWRRCVIRDNDQVQISHILGIATDILGRALCQRPPCQDSGNSISRSLSSCSEGFTILPKKVKVGQNKVVVMLTEPLQRDDTLKIEVEKSGELIEIRSFKCRNPFTLQFSVPDSCMEISTMVEIRIEKNNKSLGARPIKCESRLRELEQLLRIEDSPIEFMCHSLGICPTERDALDLHLLQCFQKNMPPNFHLLSGPSEKQQFLTLRETRPEEYPTLLHFAARWGLNRLCIQLMECPGGDTACGIRNCAAKTPAELAEMEGHHKLAQNIVSFSEFHELTTMYHYFKGIGSNKDQQKSVTLCNKTGAAPKVFIEPQSPRTKQLKAHKPPLPEPAASEYMEMSSGSERENTPEVKPKAKVTETMAVSNLNYISVETEDENLQGSSADICKNFDTNKVITSPEETTTELRISEPPYHQSDAQKSVVTVDEVDAPAAAYQTDKFSQECSQLLESCNLSAQCNDYVLQPSNIPIDNKPTTPSSSALDDGNYLFQPSNRPVEPEVFQQMHGIQPQSAAPMLASSQRFGSLRRTASDASNSTTRSNVDDELAEIMHDFKNNVLSIRDVEVLVEKWKHRNDVKKSFREKQDQIDQLRREYERIQAQIKSELKRETPFEKIKKLFSRHKSSDKHSCADSALDETKSSITTNSSFKSNQRPISSLSLQSVASSSSSGRLSTGSNCSGTSLVDSGTHSDHEERRFANRLATASSLMDNYLVPPPPRPVYTPTSTPGDERLQLVFPSPMSSTQRLNSPTSPGCNTNIMEHYQMFPSNIPVYTSQNLGPNPCNNYLNTIIETKEQDNQCHQSVNVTLQPIKVNERANIIYGKLTKNTGACSSFKPKQIAAPQVASGSSIEVQAEVYQNVGDHLDALANETTAINENGGSGGSDGENHNYINC